MRQASSLPGSVFALGLSALLLATSLTGCLLDSSNDDGDGERPLPDPNPPPSPPEPPAPPAPQPVPGGTYQVDSQLDLTVESVLPEPAAQLVVTLRDFSTQPAHTLLDLSEEAGVPAVAELRAALPDALESRLEGWIDEEIAKLKVNEIPITTLAGGIAYLSETTLTRLSLQSELVLGDGRATHRLKTVSTFAGPLPLGELPDEVVSASAAMTATPSFLILGDHQLGIAYGTYVWMAMEQFSTVFGGAPLRTALGTTVNCPALAATIAGKCFLGVCVGHAVALTQICERGLDEVVDRAHAKVTSIRFTALRLAGRAVPQDNNLDLLSGDWTARLDVGMGLRPAPATFSATR